MGLILTFTIFALACYVNNAYWIREFDSQRATRQRLGIGTGLLEWDYQRRHNRKDI